MRPLPRSLAAALVGLGLTGSVLAAPTPTYADTVTPRNLTGYGFDQCLAPSKVAMRRWMDTSPFLAAGIYISGDSRGCRDQPNLTPGWIDDTSADGWRLLPITLGPQASCSTRYPRYGDDETITDHVGPAGGFKRAFTQGQAEARKTIGVAKRLGIAKPSTLWYDLEAFDISQRACRLSALQFLSGWTTSLVNNGYLSGVYSSAASGIRMLDDARKDAGDNVRLPNYLWIADWNGQEGTSTSYISDAGWNPHRRVHQYQGGHDETWGGVTINIDRNWLDVGRGTVAPPKRRWCGGGIRINYPDYPRLSSAAHPPRYTKALQCMLKDKGVYRGKVNGAWGGATITAMQAWQRRVGHAASGTWSRIDWATLTSAGQRPSVKFGSGEDAVRRVQRTLNALNSAGLAVDGVFGRATGKALRAYQSARGLRVSGVTSTPTWRSWQR